MCTNCERTFRSSPRPRMNISAVAPFTRMPAAATHMTVISTTGCGLTSRRMASTPMAPTLTSRIAAFTSTAKIELRPQPYVRRSVGGRRVSHAAPHPSSSPSTSPRLWAASASSAIELAATPNPTSATTKPRFSAVPIANARSKPLAAPVAVSVVVVMVDVPWLATVCHGAGVPPPSYSRTGDAMALFMSGKAHDMTSLVRAMVPERTQAIEGLTVRQNAR